MAGEARISNDRFISLHEMSFDEIFPMLAEEDARLKGGPYQRGYVPIEDMLSSTPDMEDIIDARRTSVPSEEFEEESARCDQEWGDFHPKVADLEPFYTVMAVADGDSSHPGFSSPSSKKASEKVMYHRGGKTIRLRKAISP